MFAVVVAARAGTLSAQAPDVVFVATPMEVVIGMLNLAGVSERDVVYDLGSGDGRIVIAAAKHHLARGVGVEIDANLVAESRRSADSAGVSQRVEFRQGDLFQTDLREASVVTLYLGRTLNQRLRPKLFRELRPGSRVVSQNFDMGDWMPDSLVMVRGRHFGETPVHLWVMPANVAGTWQVSVEGGTLAPSSLRLVLDQRYQRVMGEARTGDRRLALTGVTLRGERIGFTVVGEGAELRFQGVVSGDSAGGTVGAGSAAGRHEWRGVRARRARSGRLDP